MTMPRNHLPALTAENAFFWHAGERGVLRFMRCQGCRHYVHPPLPICPVCKSREVRDEAVSGKGTILT
jgi:uncharacterized OB-fold protein